MSTRGAIAEPYGDTWRGRYHHFDSYPSGLGRDLWNLYHTVFNEDIDLMRKVLIHDHPAGWSSLDGDWTQMPGFVEDIQKSIDLKAAGKKAPACYCHGDRSEEGSPPFVCNCLNEDEASCDPLFIEWAYILGDNNLFIIEAFNSGGEYPNHKYKHRMKGMVYWNGPEPDWGKFESHDDDE